jgi:uncharacterized protein
MKRHILFIQGGGKGAYEVDSKLVASLQRTLGADYEVTYPKMPNEDSPDYESWKGQIKKEIVALDGEMILIGHSVGGYILVKYLSEESPPENPMSGIFLLAAPYPGGDEDWQFEGFSLPEDFGTKLPKDTPIFLYHSQDDRTVPFAHVGLYAKAIPKATLRETKGGHQLHNDLSVVAKDMKENL